MRRMVSSFLAAMVGLSVLVVVASLANAAASYTFTQIDVPGATQTTPFGINDRGKIVGFFIDSTGVHGFLRDTSGSFTTIDVPGLPNGCTTEPGQINSAVTEARGINNAGEIVGFFGCPRNQHGFLFAGGSFTQLDVLAAAEDINNVEQIVGVGVGGGVLLEPDGTVITFSVPGSQSETEASGINDAGQIVGTFITPPPPTGGAAQRHGFLRDTSGSFTTIDVPGANQTLAGGINNTGQIVGSFDITSSLEHTHGFLYTGGSFTIIDVPGATETGANGINDAGQIVGAFRDSTGEHGFLATPVVFAGTPGKPNCHGQSVSALARQFGGLNNAAAALGYASVQALQKAIMEFCEG